MINRMNKLTALLVAATAVASIVPATSASASTKLETLEGNIQDVQAFDGGKYVFDGYKNDDQETGLYLFNGTKDVQIEDVDGTGVKYGDGLLNFADDDVLFNLKSEKAEEDTAEDKQAYMETKFRTSVLRKADRYEDTQNIELVAQLNEGQFGDVWFEYTVKNDDASESYTVFMNEAGKYVDASKTLNIVHYNKENTKFRLDTFDDAADEGYTTTTSAVIFADEDYVYRTVSLTNDTDSAVYLQKISKAQGEKEDEAYLPKSVYSYEISDEALAAITPGEGISVRVVKGDIYSIDNTEEGKLTIEKYDLKRVKEDGLDKKKVELDKDFDDVEDEDIADFDIDVNGNVWTLYKGDIKKVVDGKLTTMFTVDRTMNELSVYDDNDIVAWNTEDEIYATVAETEETPEKPVEKGWVKNSDGTWSFVKEDGVRATGWYNDNGTWYALDSMGVMQTGWFNDRGTWYFLDASGAMKTGWVKDGANWYFLNSSGTMKTGWVKDGANWYYLQSTGAMKTGWLNDNGTWYYLNANGSMAANTTVGGYKLGANGAWIR